MEKKKSKELTPIISLSEISKVENPLLNEKQLNMLLAETPKSHIYQRPAKGGGTWDYVTGIYVNKVLNMVFGWDTSFEVKQFEYNLETKQAIVLGRLSVRVKDKTIVKEQFGRSDIAFKTIPIYDDNGRQVYETGKDGKQKAKRIQTNEPLDLGNDLKAAATDALKKCASQLGIASDIYGPDEFKQIRVVGETDSEQIENIQKQISDQLTHCQDREMVQVITERILEAEAHGINTLEFYNEILGIFI
jgi:hypothetical protein